MRTARNLQYPEGTLYTEEEKKRRRAMTGDDMHELGISLHVYLITTDKDVNTCSCKITVAISFFTILLFQNINISDYRPDHMHGFTCRLKLLHIYVNFASDCQFGHVNTIEYIQM